MDRKVLEVILRVTPEKLYINQNTCKKMSHQEVKEEYFTERLREMVPHLQLHLGYSWTCTRPKGHDGPHVACWRDALCPIEPWWDLGEKQ